MEWFNRREGKWAGEKKRNAENREKYQERAETDKRDARTVDCVNFASVLLSFLPPLNDAHMQLICFTSHTAVLHVIAGGLHSRAMTENLHQHAGRQWKMNHSICEEAQGHEVCVLTPASG